MRSFLLAALNCFVGNEPRVAATAQIGPSSVRPARDVALVLIGHAESKPLDFNSSRLRKVKEVLVAIVKKPFRIDWLEMTVRLQIALSTFNCDRFDPVNRVLQKKSVRGGCQFDYDLVGQHRIRWRGANVQKKRSVRS